MAALLYSLLHRSAQGSERKGPDPRNLKTWRQFLLGVIAKRSTRLMTVARVVAAWRRVSSVKSAAMALGYFLEKAAFPMRPLAPRLAWPSGSSSARLSSAVVSPSANWPRPSGWISTNTIAPGPRPGYGDPLELESRQGNRAILYREMAGLPVSARRRVTIQKVARAYGVAPSTVSNALSGKNHVSDETRSRIVEVAQQMGYRPSAIAASLRMQRSWSIGPLIGDITNPSLPELVRGVEDVVVAEQCNLILCNTDYSPEKEASYLRLLLDKQVDGLILASQESNSEAVVDLQKQGVPFVLLKRRHHSVKASYVGLDNKGGIGSAITHLVDWVADASPWSMDRSTLRPRPPAIAIRLHGNFGSPQTRPVPGAGDRLQIHPRRRPSSCPEAGYPAIPPQR